MAEARLPGHQNNFLVPQSTDLSTASSLPASKRCPRTSGIRVGLVYTVSTQGPP